ncbi:MAG: hypothetical protein J6T03_07745, partial [Bacteroidales bacterium]|nr:hypothetical protein [Bacteroidales bacterium]
REIVFCLNPAARPVFSSIVADKTAHFFYLREYDATICITGIYRNVSEWVVCTMAERVEGC